MAWAERCGPVSDRPPSRFLAGLVGADGTYQMRFRNSDDTAENILVGEDQPDPANWRYVTLQQDPDRPNVFAGETSRSIQCIEWRSVTFACAVSVRLTAPQDVNGRQTAARMPEPPAVERVPR
jgi:hypothetical protein